MMEIRLKLHLLEYVAKKETTEETGLTNIKVLGTLAAIDSLCVHSHIKRGKFVSSHLHLNYTYIIEADEKDKIRILPDENSKIGWLEFDELLEKSTEKHMIPVYKKLIAKIKENKF